MEIVLSVLVGIGLSAACGFRVFVPPLVISLASFSGHLSLAHGFEWMGTWPALIAFALATVLEIVAYYVPWLDNVLDLIATPAAIVAGVVMTAAAVTDVSPFLKWTLAVIAGGGVAALVQIGTVKVRAVSTALTAGIGNHVVSTVEWFTSVLISVVSVVLPIAGALLVCLALGMLTWRYFRKRKAKAAAGGV